LTSDRKVFFKSPVINARERTAVKGEQPSPVKRCAAVAEKCPDRTFHLARAEWMGKLPLVAEYAPMRTPEVRNKNRDYKRG